MPPGRQPPPLRGGSTTPPERSKAPPRRRRWLPWGIGGGILVLVVLAVVVVVTMPRASTAKDPVVASSAPPAPAPVVTPMGSASPEPRPQPDSAATLALETLSGLAVVSEGLAGPYNRDAFGQRWADIDRNGCDTRNDILGRDLLDPVFKEGTGDCKVLSGVLHDPYDDSEVVFVSGQNTSVFVQVDHVVALSWAWHHGAYAWTDEQRVLFANDPGNLVAASQATNQSKSASGPANWLPPVPELSCRYIQQWVSVLGEYQLGISVEDQEAARRVLVTC